MATSNRTDHEYHRLAALRAYEVLDTPPDPMIDQIVDLAASVFEMPIVCVSLVDSRRLFLKATHGVDATELGAEPGMCVTVVKTNAPHQIHDLLTDRVAAKHPLVAGEPNVRFYAGTPLRSRDGYAIGTLCLLDQQPRELDQMQMGCLGILAELVMSQLETQRREREARAETAAHDRYSSLVTFGSDAPPPAVLSLSDDGTVVYANPQARQFTGLAQGEPVGEADWPQAVIDAEEINSQWAEWCHGPASDNAFTLAIPTTDAGALLLHAQKDVAADGSTRGFTATIREVRDTAGFGSQMLQAQKLESLGALAGGIAHDFNNILAAIIGNSSLAAANVTDSTAVTRHLENIDTAADRAGNLCDQLLAYSGGGQFTVAAFDLSELVRDTSDLLDVIVSKKAEARLDLSKSLPAIEGDSTQVRQVIMNVLSNASEALHDEPGVIDLSTTCEFYDAATLHAMFFGQALEPGEYVTLTVTDTGSGMDHQTIQRVFDPLFSTKFAGHGLGMSAVGGIMRVHNGAVSISSRVGTGTTIRLLFPASDAAIVTHKPQSSPLVSRQERGTILVVEDEPAIREVVVETLQGAGYDVLSAADGAIAQDLIRRNRKPITGAVIDMMMPNVDGAELHEHLLDVAPDIQVILTSGYNEKEATRRIVTSGRAGFVKKPYRPAELLAELDVMLANVERPNSRRSGRKRSGWRRLVRPGRSVGGVD